MARPQLPPDFKEFLKFCLAREVRFMVVGGIAVVYHGHPRLTLDLDLWIEPTAENGARIIEALKDFGFRSPEVTPEDFTKAKQILRLGFKPVVIEIFNHIPGIDFAECFPRRIMAKMGKLNVPFIGLDDLKANKRACGRPKDLQDLDDLP
jgi:hypothetical protein